MRRLQSRSYSFYAMIGQNTGGCSEPHGVKQVLAESPHGCTDQSSHAAAAPPHNRRRFRLSHGETAELFMSQHRKREIEKIASPSSRIKSINQRLLCDKASTVLWQTKNIYWPLCSRERKLSQIFFYFRINKTSGPGISHLLPPCCETSFFFAWFPQNVPS